MVVGALTTVCNATKWSIWVWCGSPKLGTQTNFEFYIYVSYRLVRAKNFSGVSHPFLGLRHFRNFTYRSKSDLTKHDPVKSNPSLFKHNYPVFTIFMRVLFIELLHQPQTATLRRQNGSGTLDIWRTYNLRRTSTRIDERRKNRIKPILPSKHTHD